MKKIIILVSLLSLGGCAQISGVLFNETTVYPVVCDGEADIKENICKGKLRTLNRITFKVFVDRQEVIYWLPGVEKAPYKLLNCVVKDSENWHCEDGVWEFSRTVMEKGRIRNTFREGIYYVSWWRWWTIKLLGVDPDGGRHMPPDKVS